MANGQWTEVEARGLLAAIEKSERSIPRYCEERGLENRRVYWWRKKLGLTKRKGAGSMALLPVHVVERAEVKRGEPVTVLLRSGHVVKLGRGFDEDAFVRVVALLEGA